MNTNEIRHMLSKATARPWVWAHIFDGENVIQGHHADHVAITETARDAALVVALVNNAEALLAENERLRALCIDLNKKYTNHTKWCSISYGVDAPCDCGYGEVVERLNELTKP